MVGGVSAIQSRDFTEAPVIYRVSSMLKGLDAPAYDANRIAPKLHQGSFPAPDEVDLRQHGIYALVLCANELQPPKELYPGIVIIRAPMDDIDGVEGSRSCVVANMASAYVARLIRAGKRVLVTCAAGRNRSGLVTALTLARLGWDPHAAVYQIQRCRKNALTNRFFREFALRTKVEDLTPENVALGHRVLPVEKS